MFLSTYLHNYYKKNNLTENGKHYEDAATGKYTYVSSEFKRFIQVLEYRFYNSLSSLTYTNTII